MDRMPVDAMAAGIFQAYYQFERRLAALAPKDLEQADILLYVALALLAAHFTERKISQGMYLFRDMVLGVWSLRIGRSPW